MSDYDVFRGVGVIIDLANDVDFNKVAETLTRIGSCPKNSNTLYQSCHILHKRGQYAIVHFKEMFELDGLPSSFDESDRSRRNRITKYLEKWGLVTIIDTEIVNEKEEQDPGYIKIIPFKDKNNWKLIQKYTIGS